MTTSIVHLVKEVNTDWKDILLECIEPHVGVINNMLNKEPLDIFPPSDNVFAAFKKFDQKDLKVVIVGQDCYHTPGMAHGLCFSVPKTCGKLPPSLRVIFKELEHEYGGPMRTETDLSDWAEQGVLLLNCALTVRVGTAGSHLKYWKPIVDTIMEYISSKHQGIVFMLWGNFAQTYKDFIDTEKNLVLKARHPSPLAASKGPFVGNMHFTRANEYLNKHGKNAVTWLK
jgi:uracil-DNA glycosylase